MFMAPILQARAEWEANSTPAPRMRRQGRCEVTDQFRQYEDVIAILEWTELCVISKVETLRPHVGAATRLLQFLKSLADRHQITLFGNATAYCPDEHRSKIELLSQDQLETWYERQGFRLHRGSLGIVEIWYPSAPYAAQPPSAADAAQAPRR